MDNYRSIHKSEIFLPFKAKKSFQFILFLEILNKDFITREILN